MKDSKLLPYAKKILFANLCSSNAYDLVGKSHQLMTLY